MGANATFVRSLFDDAWSQGRTEDLAERVGELTFHYGGNATSTDDAARRDRQLGRS